MRRFYLRYLLFWLPALLVAYFYSNETMYSQVLQWFFAFVMIFGWSINTGMAAYRYPRTTISLLLIYSGWSLLAIVLMNSSYQKSFTYRFARDIGGALSFRPLDILVRTLLDYDLNPEYYVVGALLAFCLAGYIVGMIYRRVRPNPYRPRIVGKS